MTPNLNAFQIAALETYSDGEFSYLKSVPPEEFEHSLATCGDILLPVILAQLSPTLGCRTRSDAILRLAEAAEEIDLIVSTLYEARAKIPTRPGTESRQRQNKGRHRPRQSRPAGAEGESPQPLS